MEGLASGGVWGAVLALAVGAAPAFASDGLELLSGRVPVERMDEAIEPGARAVLVLDGALDAARRAALEGAGVRLVQPLGDRAFVVRVTGEAQAVERLDFVRGLSSFEGSWKTSSGFGVRRFSTLERLERARRGRLGVLVHMFADASPEEIDEAIGVIRGRPGGVFHRARPVGANLELSAEIDPGGVEALRALGGVQYVEHAPEITLRNGTVRWIVQSNEAGMTPLHDSGITGLGQVVGVCDDGLDAFHCSFADTPGKIVAVNGGPVAMTHGTHVAATAVGNPTVGGEAQGHAFDAGLVFSVTPAYTQTGLADVLELQSTQAARIHTNSWGDDTTREYTGMARAIDAFMHENENDLVIFAVTNTSTLKTPENAKNALAVAASADTPDQDELCSGGGTLTSDLRLKPDVVAPGCSILSALSGTSCSVTPLSGTSMAAPAVAGTAALLRQYFVEGFYPTGVPTPGDEISPTGALLKACLINSATGMGGVPDLPSNESAFLGWGRVLADDVVALPGDDRWTYVEDVRNAAGLLTGGQVEHPFDVLASSEPLRITVCWTGPAPAPGVSEAGVNNLDVELIAPDMSVYRGNNFAGGVSVTGGAPDSKNNVEQVHIESPAIGTWTVRITGASVPAGPQGYAMVVTGGIAVPPRALGVAAIAPPSLVAPGDHASEFSVVVDEGDDALIPGSASLHYRYSGAAFGVVPLTDSGDGTFTATLPAASCGHTPHFYVSATGLASGVRTSPPGAPMQFYAASLGAESEIEVFREEFDSGLPASWGATGLWHTTSGCESLPSCGNAPWAYFGSEPICGYGTGATERGTLTAPGIALPPVGPGERILLRYCSSLDNENFLFYDRGILRVDGVLIEEAPFTGGVWENREIDLTALAGQTVELTWTFDSLDSVANAFGGWQIDDVVVVRTTIACIDPCPADLDGDLDVDVFDFNQLAPAFGTPINATRAQGDIDGDGDVDVFDFNLFAPAFGDVCVP